MPRNVLGHRLITCVNDRMRKTKTFCNACMCYDLLLTLFMNEEVCLLLHIEGSFVLLPEDDMTAVVDICGHVAT